MDACLCIVRKNSSNCEQFNLEVLAMKDYGVKESWTTIFVLSLDLEFPICNELVPLCSIQSAEGITKILLCATYAFNWEIWACNPNEYSHRDVLSKWSSYCAVVYEESLVKPTGYNWEEDKRAGKPLRVVENRFSGNSQKLETTGTWMHFRGGRT